ncbi:UbiA family prenyltransferase [Streptomyces sp. NRAIS4]
MSVLETRPGVQTLYVVRFLTAAVLGVMTSGGSVSWSLVAALASWIFSNMFVYLLNGLMDVTEDRINGSQRPIAAGLLSISQATRVAVLFAVLGVALTLLTPLPACLTLIGHLVLGWLYSGPPLYAKRHPLASSSILVLAGICCYAAGYWATGAGAPNAETLIFVLAMSLAMGIVGVPVKDLSDIEGDRAAGRRSWPVLWGERNARIAICCVALAMGLAFLLATFIVAPRVVGASAVTMAGFSAIGVIVLSRLGKGSRSKRRRAFRVFIIGAYCAHVACILNVYCS